MMIFDLQDESIRNLAGTLREMLSTTSAVPDLPKIPNATDVIKDISRQSLQVASLIDEYTKLPWAVRTAKIQIPGDLKSRIDACQKSCADLKDTFSSRLQVTTYIQVGEIKAGQQKIGQTLEVIKNDELAKKIRQWLSPSDSSENRYQADKKREDGTCDWFFNEDRVHKWQASPGFLWVQGKAGSGKTILCSSVINKLSKPSQENLAFGIAYFFFDGRDSQSKLQLHDNLIRSLISQFSHQRGGIPKELDDLYKRCGDHQKPSVDQLQDTLLDILAGFSDVYIVIDALDECTDRKETLKWISRLVPDPKAQNLHIVVTSRPESDIQTVFEGLDPNSIEATANQDIIRYLERQMKSKFDNYREDIRKKIESGLRKRADGSFRWVALQLAELENCLSEDEIEKQMNNLPKDLDDIYKRMLKAIDGKYRADTKTFLEWLAFSKRPLEVAEIAEAVTVDFHSEGGPAFNAKKRYSNPRDMLVRCSSLVTESEGTIKLSHFSVKEYLLSNRVEENFNINEKAAHVKIWEISVAYLLQFNSFKPLTRATIRSSPLALYAAKHWIDHTKSGEIGPALLKLVLRLFRPKTAALTNWIRMHNIDYEGYQDLSMDKAEVLSPLYYASLAGLQQVSKHLLETDSDVDVNVQGGLYGNALQAASVEGHEEIVELLLEKGARVNAHGGQYGNALQAASENNCEPVVKLLLDKGADPNVQGGLYGNVLQAASAEGHEAIVKLLLGKGANVNAQGGEYGSALQAASENNHERVVKLLLDKGADPNVQGGLYGNVLQAASTEGRLEIVKLLLDKGAGINMQGGLYGNALQAASRKGHEAIVKLLLKRGANVNAQGGRYGTALQAASECGHRAIVKLLETVDVNAQGDLYDTQAMSKLPILIILLGETGSGKSSFINAVAGKDIARVGHGLNSITTDVEEFEIDYKGQKITLVDTPQFDGYKMTKGADLLEEIANHMLQIAPDGRISAKVIYTHRIDNRVSNQQPWQTQLFRDICGQGGMKNLTVVTTFCDQVENKFATRHQPGFLELHKPYGAVLERSGTEGDPASGMFSTPQSIVDRIIERHRLPHH